MSYTITNECISCDRCINECPQSAISRVNGQLFIDSNLCNNCVGHYSTPQCAAICPTNSACMIKMESESNYWDSWFARYKKGITQLKKQPYWENWFDVYSQHLTNLN